MLPPPSIAPIATLALLAILPLLGTWLIVLVPCRRRESSGLIVGNPLEAVPLAPIATVVSKPLVHLIRSLSGNEIEGFILGLRHLPVEQSAPLLTRFVNGSDPALQLYAQGILQQSREELTAQFHKLQKLPADEPRTATWLLETGLRLAHPSLCGPTERPGFIAHLVAIAAQRLHTSEPSPALLSKAAEVFLHAGLLDEAQAALDVLPKSSLSGKHLAAQLVHARHQQALA